MAAAVLDKIETVSIHAPRTGGDESAIKYMRENEVSIHAPRTGGDFNLTYYG